ncbi:MAG: ABC transporter ATP-binding protein [Nitrospira sp. CG24E]|mgnify:CR=1 FL=1|nr:MAG: ABC transporter ATP-binding protein [Nitrospira sp. CG24E]
MGIIDRLTYLRTLLSFAFRENPLLYVSIIVSVLSVFLELAAMTMLLPLSIIAAGQPLPNDMWVVRIINEANFEINGQSLFLVFLALFGLRIVTQFVGEALTLFLSKRMLSQLATRAFSSLVNWVPLKDVEKTSIGSFITLVGDESFRASNLVIFLSQFASLLLLSGLYFGAIWVYSPVVGIGLLAFMGASFLAMFESFRFSHRLGIRQVEQSQSAGSLFLDALNGLRSVRAFSAEGYVTESYRTQMSSYMRTLFSIDLISLLTRLGPALLLLGAVAAVTLWPAASTHLSMEFTFIVTVVILLMRFFPVVGQALSVALRVAADAKAGRDVTKLIQEYGEGAARVDAHQLGQIETIEACGLDFSHNKQRAVLKGFDIVLKRGSSYALKGLSGSGKSTFLDLLMRFYPVEQGRLLINGTPFESLSIGDLRRRVLLVSQETTIFNDTVANNVRFGSHANYAELERACRIACIHDSILGLPNGYEAMLSYRGTNLSGGQRQRIGIARALLRRPDVLLLDESTSALDVDTREQLVRYLREEFADRILLFVTHDAFVISRMDEVFDMAVINRSAPQQAGLPTESRVG